MGHGQQGWTFREEVLMDVQAQGKGLAIRVSQLLCLRTTWAERAGHLTSAPASSLSTLPCRWEMSPELVLTPARSLACVLGSAMRPLIKLDPQLSF